MRWPAPSPSWRARSPASPPATTWPSTAAWRWIEPRMQTMEAGGQAVVVGATGEVGAAIVARLRTAAVPVVAVARDRDRLAQLCAGDDGISGCAADIGDDSAGEAIAAAVTGPVRMVVQAA